MTNNTSSSARKRRMAREPQGTDAAKAGSPAKAPSRLDMLERLLTEEGGATIAAMVEASGWQQHSVRGAMAGALKKRGLAITSEKVDGVRLYRASKPA